MTYAAATAMLDPLTHCTGPWMKPEASSETQAAAFRFLTHCTTARTPVSFYCMNAVARTSNIMLNTSGESQHLCPFPDFSGKVFSFSLFSIMLAVGSSQIAFIMLRYIPSLYTLW